MVGRTLTRKLLRDLVAARTQIAAIAAIVACGVAVLVTMASVYDSLRLTQVTYYARYAFADAFATLVRAPESVAVRLAAIPGVETIETRVVVPVTVDLPGRTDPASALLVSLPDGREPRLNRVFLRAGRALSPRASGEALVSEAFAAANRLHPGDRFAVIVNGRRQAVRVAGIALSPEYVYEIGPGAIWPDSRRYGILWMNRSALAAAYDMTGAFDDVAFRLSKAGARDVLVRIDAILDRYGGRGAFLRADQVSNWFLTSELVQLRTEAVIIPLVFLGVAAFLAHALLLRLVATERAQIGTLKAFGYASGTIVRHYVAFGLAVVFLGGIVGIALGIWFGHAVAAQYEAFFRFPMLTYRLAPAVVVLALAVCGGAAVLGAWNAARTAARLAPAEAMQPEAPAHYRPALLERLRIGGVLPPAWRIALRDVERQPLRSAVTVLGVACATALLVVGLASNDSASRMIALQFRSIAREDVTVSLVRTAGPSALPELRALPGVLRVDPYRSVPARLRHDARTYRIAVTGAEPGGELHRLLGAGDRPIAPPFDGIVLSVTLARILDARVGDRIGVETLEGKRRTFAVQVTALVDQPIGMDAVMARDALDRRLGEDGTLDGAYLAIDPLAAARFDARIKRTPRVAAVAYRADALAQAEQTIEEGFQLSMRVLIAFAVTMAFGVVYNAARIALAERSRELATLRIVGFSRSEIAAVLLGEQAGLAAIAIPLGLVLGYGLFAAIATAYRTELYRIPIVVVPQTDARAALVIVAASLASGGVVAMRLRRLDLVSVLKGE